MGKINKTKQKSKSKSNKKNQSKKEIHFDRRFKVEKSKGNKDKKNRSITFAKYEKKKIQNQQFESIQKLDTKMDRIQNSIRNPIAEKFEQLKTPNKPADINQAIEAINSL